MRTASMQRAQEGADDYIAELEQELKALRKENLAQRAELERHETSRAEMLGAGEERGCWADAADTQGGMQVVRGSHRGALAPFVDDRTDELNVLGSRTHTDCRPSIRCIRCHAARHGPRALDRSLI